MFCLESFQMMANGERVSTFFSLIVNYRRISTILLKKSRFVEDVLFHPKKEVMAFPKTEIKWDWVSDVHVCIKSDAVILFWRYYCVRTRQTFENQITDRKCVVQTNSRVIWRYFYSGMSKFSCLVFVLFSAVFMLSTRFYRTSGNGMSYKT